MSSHTFGCSKKAPGVLDVILTVGEDSARCQYEFVVRGSMAGIGINSILETVY